MDIRIAGAWALSLIIMFWAGVELEQWKLGRLVDRQLKHIADEMLTYPNGNTFVAHGVANAPPTPTPK